MNINPHDNRRKKVTCRQENAENVTKLKESLINENWQDVFRENDANKAYENFINKLIFYYDKNIPLIQLKQETNRKKSPWITQGILNSIKNRNNLYKLYIRNPSEQKHQLYKNYRNKLTNIIRNSKKLYFTGELNKAEGNPNSTWKVLNEIMNKSKPHNKIDSLNINDQEINNSADIAEAFNSFFTNIGPELASKIPHNNTHFSEYLPQQQNNTIFFHPTNEDEIIKTVNAFKSKKSSGYDGISTKLLKQIIYCIVSPLEHVFNLSLSTGTCPDLLKTAKVVPVFKKDDPTRITNYRPISLLPSISKILEKIVYTRLESFLSANKILNPTQFGFRKNFSTDFAIAHLLDKITDAFTKKEHAIAIFMDLSKAFDTINHDILIYKLRNYGIRGTALSWFRSYLSNRQQYVFNDNNKSSMLNVRCGVPQGSILGPLLFLIYINDITKSSSTVSFILFADDTNILYSHKDLTELVNTLNTELTNISSWFKCNKLSLNIAKTNFIHFQTLHSNTELPHHIKIDDLSLLKKDCTKFLGITIDKNLTWDQHIQNISSQIAKGIGILYKTKDVILNSALLTLYNTLILPFITYCNIIWGNCNISKLNQIYLLQKKAVRICTNSPYLAHTDPLFHKLNILKVHDINILQTSIFMFKYTKDLLPPIFNNLFTYNRNIHSYPTRTCNNIHLRNPKLLLAHKSLRHHGPDVWNTLPNFIKETPFLNFFKRLMKTILLNKYTS